MTIRGGLGARGVFWTPIVLYRFSFECGEAHEEVSPVVRGGSTVKAPEGWRSPKSGGILSSGVSVIQQMHDAEDGADALWIVIGCKAHAHGVTTGF